MKNIVLCKGLGYGRRNMPSLQFIKSAAQLADCPPLALPEIALAGRSNSGKSSFLNGFSGLKLGKVQINSRRPVAKVSSTAGKTRLLNFFDVAGKYCVVDMPGYGYAARAEDEKHSWKALVETYLQSRPNLVGVVLFIDIRREWDSEEKVLKKFLNSNGIPICVVLTKKDKISESQVEKIRQAFLKKSDSPVFAISNLQNKGIEEVENFCFKNWVKPFDKKGALNSESKA